MHRTTVHFAGLLVMALPLATALAMEGEQQNPADELLSSLSEPLTVDGIRLRWTEYLKGQQANENQTAAVLAIWSQGDRQSLSRERLGRIVESIKVLHPEAFALAEKMRIGKGGDAKDSTLLTVFKSDDLPSLLQDHLNLWIAQGWVQQGRYVEALTLLESIKPSHLLDPVSSVFALATIHHQQTDKKRGMQLLEWLQTHQDRSPNRYTVLGDLMYEDLRQLKVGSLDDISRRMKQIRQQLELGRTGDRVLKTEDEVLRMLDKLIEAESKKQSKQSQTAGQGFAPSQGAEASRPIGGKGPGQVTKKKIGQSTGWGDLPPKEREQAMQELSREFPAHYRDVIEAYFRELARQQK